jgi:hypothetical protein
VAFPFVAASRLLRAAELAGSNVSFGEAAVEYLLSQRWVEDAADLDAIASLDRGLLTYFTDVVRQAGDSVPYMSGCTLIEGVETLAPRLLYPDKPPLNIGNWTGQEFGWVHWQDELTNVSPTFIGEFYMNFGLIGVCVGMLLLGMLAVLVDRYLIVRRDSWTMAIMVACIGWQEAFVGHTILPFIKGALLWVPLLLILKAALSGRSVGTSVAPSRQ